VDFEAMMSQEIEEWEGEKSNGVGSKKREIKIESL